MSKPNKQIPSSPKKKNITPIKKISVLDIDPENFVLENINMKELDHQSDEILNLSQIKEVAKKFNLAPPKGETWSKMQYINAIKKSLNYESDSDDSGKQIKLKPVQKVKPKPIESDSDESEKQVKLKPAQKVKSSPIKKKKAKAEVVDSDDENNKKKKITSPNKKTPKSPSVKYMVDSDGEEIKREKVDSDDEDFKIKDDEIVLSQIQEEHYGIMMNILNEYNFGIDQSALGAGKTYVAMMIFLRNQRTKQNKNGLFKHLVYISTVEMLGKVLPLLEKYKLPTNHLISFDSLRSVPNKQPKHGLLTRIDSTTDNGKKQVSFEVSDDFLELVKEGVLIIADETQKAKNKSQIFKSFAELERVIITTGGRSKVLELSGLYANKEEHFINVMTRLQIVSASKFFNPASVNRNIVGIFQLEDWCMKRDPTTTRQIMYKEGRRLNKTNVKEIAFELYNSVVRKFISHDMPPPPKNEGVELFLRNAFYNLSKMDQPFFDETLQDLIRATNVDNDQAVNMGLAKTSLRALEVCQINMYIRIGEKILKANKNNKLIIALNYTLPLETLIEYFADYGVISSHGGVKAKNRNALREKFNAPDRKFRVFIGNIRVINASIDLDDKDGRYPRYLLASPSYMYIDQHQLTGRAMRGSSTKSSVHFDFMYANIENNELQLKILDKLANSGKLTSVVFEKQVQNGILFPGTYPRHVEPSNTEIEIGPLKIRDLLKKLKSSEYEDLDDNEPKRGKTGYAKPQDDEDYNNYADELNKKYPNHKVNKKLTKQKVLDSDSENSEIDRSDDDNEYVSPIIVNTPTDSNIIKKKK